MKVIVPLAGPDFVITEGHTKAEIIVDGHPILVKALTSRSWSAGVEEYIFVLKDGVEERNFVERALRKWFPLCKLCFMSHPSGGAAFSALIACGLVDDAESPIIIDLADILFDCELTSFEMRLLLKDSSALGLTFESNDSSYSYLAFDDDGKFKEAQEKNVISRYASAGVYVYQNIGCYIRAFSDVLMKPFYKYNDLHYVCPVFNGVCSNGDKVLSVPVRNIVDIKQQL